MWKKIKSTGLVIVIFMQKLFDGWHAYRKGIPALKRSRVTADLYLGGQHSLRGLGLLKKMGITAIINMRTTNIYAAAHYEGFHYLHLPTVDNTAPTLNDLVKGADFAEKEIAAKGKIYIHCRQGLGRGPTMAMAYLLKIGMTYDDAFATVKKVRTFINPTRSQRERLRELYLYYSNQETGEKVKQPALTK